MEPHVIQIHSASSYTSKPQPHLPRPSLFSTLRPNPNLLIMSRRKRITEWKYFSSCFVRWGWAGSCHCCGGHCSLCIRCEFLFLVCDKNYDHRKSLVELIKVISGCSIVGLGLEVVSLISCLLSGSIWLCVPCGMGSSRSFFFSTDWFSWKFNWAFWKLSWFGEIQLSYKGLKNSDHPSSAIKGKIETNWD